MCNPTKKLSKLLNYNEAAEILNVASITLRKWVSAGVISSVKIGSSVRFTPEMIEEFVRNSTRTGGAR
jgi:excisionase family DNA binding protein